MGNAKTSEEEHPAYYPTIFLPLTRRHEQLSHVNATKGAATGLTAMNITFVTNVFEAQFISLGLV